MHQIGLNSNYKFSVLSLLKLLWHKLWFAADAFKASRAPFIQSVSCLQFFIMGYDEEFCCLDSQTQCTLYASFLPHCFDLTNRWRLWCIMSHTFVFYIHTSRVTKISIKSCPLKSFWSSGFAYLAPFKLLESVSLNALVNICIWYK